MVSLPELVRAALDRDPTQPAVEFNGSWQSWGELRQVAISVASALSACGVDPKAPVAFVPRNRPEALAALLGLIAVERSIRMIYPFQSAAGIARSIAQPGIATVVMHSSDCVEAVRECLAERGITAVLLNGMAVEALDGQSPGVQKFESEGPSKPAIEILTSGTTGPPKHFALPYSLLETHFVVPAQARTETGDPALAPPALLYFAIGNISGIYSSLPPLLRGQRVVLLERFSIEAWHDYVLRYRPSQSGVPPSYLQQILDLEIPPADLASIGAMGSGAAPLDPQLQRAFEQRYGIPILVSYGATEFAGPVAMMTAELHAEWGEAKIGTVGRPLPGVRFRVIDTESRKELPRGETGLLQVVSPRIGPDWICTSDLAVIDPDGFLFIRGRADNAIMRGGFKILPETVEAALMLHPAVQEAAVTGIPDNRLGQVPAAALRLATGSVRPPVQELEAHLRQHVLATHIPVRWVFCDELPRTPSLKVDRSALRVLVESA